MGNNYRKQVQGLSAAEVLQRRSRDGFNELPSSKPRSGWYIILQVMKEPMFMLLVACGTLYMLLGDVGEGLMLLSSVIIIIIITFYQERKKERALDALKELSSPRTLVIREGQEKRVSSRELVVDDWIILQEGDRVPADALVMDALNLRVDESQLTGESVAVDKTDWDGQQPFEFNTENRSSFLYSGSLLVQGHVIARVAAIGRNTLLGRIGQRLEEVKEEPTLLQKETGNIVKTFSILGFGVCILLIIVYGLTRHDWLNGILTGLSLAMAMLPEEFAVVLTIFLAMGAWRISKERVLTRRAAAVETLGAVSVLCSDKTGTLTLNQMTIRRLYAHDRNYKVPEEQPIQLEEHFHFLMECAMLASQLKPFEPMEKAILQFGEAQLSGTEHIHGDWELVKEYPLSPTLLAMSRVFREPGQARYVVAAKGSPEAILDLCKPDTFTRSRLEQEVASFAAEGLRVLGVAHAYFQPEALPAAQQEFHFEFAGFLGLEDPLRPGIAADIQACYEAGIRVIMITGDYPVTATAIARKMGLQHPERVITGAELAAMNELQLREKIRETHLFARVMPEQKLLLVEALKANGAIVGMTGDGVNDAPALKAAHIGIAMGERGTDVAREAAALVLMDDNFSSIITAVQSGRRIYDNMQKAMAYIFAVHLPIAGLTLIPVFWPGMPALLFPLHIAFLELIIDPASSLIFEGEAAEKDIMQRPPRLLTQRLFGAKGMLMSALQGLGVLLVSLLVYLYAWQQDMPEAVARGMVFTALITGNIGLVLINRSWTKSVIRTFREPNPAVKWILGSAALFLVLVLYLPGLQDLFRVSALNLPQLGWALLAGVLSVSWFELWKWVRGR